MSGRFEGLSLPQLADLLHDLVLPAPVSMFPTTVGWRILGAWVLAVFAILLVHGFLKWRRNRYRRDAEVELERIERQLQSDPDALAGVGIVLKRTAMSAYTREPVAALHGHAWASFLTEKAPGDSLVRETAPMLAAVAYQRVEDPAAVIVAARRWIRHHDA